MESVLCLLGCLLLVWDSRYIPRTAADLFDSRPVGIIWGDRNLRFCSWSQCGDPQRMFVRDQRFSSLSNRAAASTSISPPPL